jgi:hypothetical protein
MKSRLHLAGLTLSLLTVATVALAQCPNASACQPETAGKGDTARLSRAVEPRLANLPVLLQVAVAPPQ